MGRKAARRLTHAECKVLAGNPLLLAASDEKRIRAMWAKMERAKRELIAATMRRFREHRRG